METGSEIIFKEGGDFLRLKAPQRAWGGTEALFLMTEIKAGIFLATVKLEITLAELKQLARDLIFCYNDLHSDINFHPLHTSLYLRFKGDGLGHFQLIGEITDQLVNNLEFVLSIDQTQLPGIVNDINSLLEEFS